MGPMRRLCVRGPGGLGLARTCPDAKSEAPGSGVLVGVEEGTRWSVHKAKADPTGGR